MARPGRAGPGSSCSGRYLLHRRGQYSHRQAKDPRGVQHEARQEIEEQLRDNAGRVVNFGPILSHYRSMIDSYADELRVYARRTRNGF